MSMRRIFLVAVAGLAAVWLLPSQNGLPGTERRFLTLSY
jgi:hypothetical protein